MKFSKIKKTLTIAITFVVLSATSLNSVYALNISDRTKYMIDYTGFYYSPATMTTPLDVEDFRQIRVLSRSGLTEAQLAKGLTGDLKEYAGDFLYIERTYGINAVYFAAICATESAWGSQPVARNNYMSWTNDTRSYYEFDTPSECFEYGALRLKSAFLAPSGECYRGDYLKDINKCYAINPDGTINKKWGYVVEDVSWGILQRAYDENVYVS